MGGTKTRTVDMSMSIDDIPEEKSVQLDDSTDEKTKTTKTRVRSRKYIDLRGRVDKTKYYLVDKAIDLLKTVSYTSFPGSVNVDAILDYDSFSRETTFPHSTGRNVKVAIVDDEVLSAIDAGKIDFDFLIATPDMMPKIAKYARTLGPKGLMPNPKNGTVTNDPLKKKKELEAGSLTIKTEKKFPLVHVTVGKIDQKDAELIANIKHLVKILDAKKVKKITISATMSPGIKLDIHQFDVVE